MNMFDWIMHKVTEPIEYFQFQVLLLCEVVPLPHYSITEQVVSKIVLIIRRLPVPYFLLQNLNNKVPNLIFISYFSGSQPRP